MAKPRVFLSSTFYDLKQVRADLQTFILSLGYDPVLSEHGSIPYGSEERLEKYCYREIDVVDILVSLIGGRFGSASESQPYSISQMELKTALQLGKQVYIFVEKPVLTEFNTYKRNKTVPNVSYHSVDNVKIFEFLDEVHRLEINNTTVGFETSRDITDYLREQWAGLFQRFLQEQGRRQEMNAIQNLEATAQTLNQLVTYLTEERRGTNKAIEDILLTNHPAFAQLRKLTGVPYRLFFTNHSELSEWLKFRNFVEVPIEDWDDAEYEEWSRVLTKKNVLLKLWTGLFDENGQLKIFTQKEWNNDWITVDVLDIPPPTGEITDEDIPF